MWIPGKSHFWFTERNRAMQCNLLLIFFHRCTTTKAMHSSEPPLVSAWCYVGGMGGNCDWIELQLKASVIIESIEISSSSWASFKWAQVLALNSIVWHNLWCAHWARASLSHAIGNLMRLKIFYWMNSRVEYGIHGNLYHHPQNIIIIRLRCRLQMKEFPLPSITHRFCSLSLALLPMPTFPWHSENELSDVIVYWMLTCNSLWLREEHKIHSHNDSPYFPHMGYTDGV